MVTSLEASLFPSASIEVDGCSVSVLYHWVDGYSFVEHGNARKTVFQSRQVNTENSLIS